MSWFNKAKELASSNTETSVALASCINAIEILESVLDHRHTDHCISSCPRSMARAMLKKDEPPE